MFAEALFYNVQRMKKTITFFNSTILQLLLLKIPLRISNVHLRLKVQKLKIKIKRDFKRYPLPL